MTVSWVPMAACVIIAWTSIAASAELDISSVDVLGIKLGDDAEAATTRLKKLSNSDRYSITPALCVGQKVEHAAKGANSELPAQRGQCKGSFGAQLDATTYADVYFLEDFPTRPGKSVVARIEVRYDYGGRALNAPSTAEIKKLLIAKYGTPRDVFGTSNDVLEWGSPSCYSKRNDCPTRGPHLSVRIGERLVFGDGRRPLSLAQATQEAVKAARPIVAPKF